MKLNYINKIKANISIYSNKKTSNYLDGAYKSIYRGKSMNFENLREYVINDDIKNIDWKTSAKTNKLYVKQFISEKKHNILFIIDNSINMSADTNFHENKKNIALFTIGTISYIAIKNNDYIGLLYQESNNIIYKPFKSNLYSLEKYLYEYDNSNISNDYDINELIDYTYENISKRMIIVLITDIKGIDSINKSTLRKINNYNDLLIVNINDNYMTGNNVFDIRTNKYIPSFLLKDKKLNDIEKRIKKEIINNNKIKLKDNNISITTISSKNEINNKIIQLLEEHKYANKY